MRLVIGTLGPIGQGSGGGNIGWVVEFWVAQNGRERETKRKPNAYVCTPEYSGETILGERRERIVGGIMAKTDLPEGGSKSSNLLWDSEMQKCF